MKERGLQLTGGDEEDILPPYFHVGGVCKVHAERFTVLRRPGAVGL